MQPLINSTTTMSAEPQPRLQKAQTWAPDIDRYKAWQKKRKAMLSKSKSMTQCISTGAVDNNQQQQTIITNHDVDELKACLELGFSFDVKNHDSRLAEVFPALNIYYTVHQEAKRTFFSRTSSSDSSNLTESETEPTVPSTLVNPGDDAEMKKMKLKQWAQVVACSLRESVSKKLIISEESEN